MNKISPGLFDVACPHFAVCSGCVINYGADHPPIYNEMAFWLKEHGIEHFSLFSGPAVGWRMRAKLAVRCGLGAPCIGLYKEGTHQVVDIPLCKVHHPAINAGVDLIKKLVVSKDLTVYQEAEKKGDLRYLQFIVERSTGRLHASFVLNFPPEERRQAALWREVLGALWKEAKGISWHSLAVNFNTRRDNVIFSPLWEVWFGERFLLESFLDVSVCFQPSSFAQANFDQFERLLQTLISWVPCGSFVAEYYAGVGVIGLVLAARGSRVLCCEINASAEECFELAKKRLPEGAGEISWHKGSSSSYLKWLADADVVVVDPPRKGLDRKLLDALCFEQRPAKLIYVSCGWSSFQRDAETLIKAGWALEKTEGHLFFPGSNHIEMLACFTRSREL